MGLPLHHAREAVKISPTIALVEEQNQGGALRSICPLGWAMRSASSWHCL